MKRARNTRTEPSPYSLKPAAIAVAVALGVGTGSGAALANPTGASVVNGQVTINQAGNLLSITNSPNSIINWQSFSIGASEITRFTQQSAASAVLNRVVGAGGSIDPSVILGALQSNGRVFLINPGGIVFGAGAQVDVAGLVASSLNLSNADFLGGRLRFTEVPGAGAVVNQGSINAASGGQVYLVGPSVTNSGIITSPKGEVILAAGNSVELVNPGTPNLRVEITAPDNEARNLGSIVADAGRVGIYAGLINHSGTVRADGAVATEDGRIILKATRDINLGASSITTANGPQGGRIEVNAGDTTLVAGTVEAKGAAGQGGTVHLLGDKVGIHGNARVDVSGQTGGGTVLAGGEFQGGAGVTAVEGAAIRNATSTFFGPDASIAADAIASGNGGRVILWSDHTTRSYGGMSARGGAAAGNGGFVETSGKVSLDVTRGPDLRAPNGLAGTWLIDPNDLIVDFGSSIVNNSAQPQFFTLGESSVIGVELINLQLDGGSNVLLTTTSAGASAGTQQGNVIIRAPIIKRASTTPTLTIGTTTLTVQAHNNIIIEGAGGIAATQNVAPDGTAVDADRLNVVLQAAFTGTGSGGVTVGGSGIATKGGSVSISGRGPIAVNAAIDTRRTPTSAAGVSLSSAAGAVTVTAPVTGSSFGASAGGAGSLLTLAGPVNTIGSFSSASLAADDMEILAPVVAGSGGIFVQTATANRPMSLGGGAGLSLTQAELSNLSTTGPVQFSSSGAATVSAPVMLGSSSVSIGSSNSFTVSPGASLTTGTALSISAPSINIGGQVNGQSVTFSNVSSMAVTAPVISSGNIDIFATGAVDLGGGAASFMLDNAELANLMNAGTGHLRINGGAMMIQNSITRTGMGALFLSGSTLGQASGAILTADNLRLNFSTVNLPEANGITTLAGSVNSLTLTNPSLLTIGSVDGASGLFTSTATVMTDDLNVVNTFSGNTVNIRPVTAGWRINLGGTDVGGELNISATDLANIFGSTVALNADRVDIRGPVSSPASVLSIAPVTAGHPLIIIGTKVGMGLEFTPADIGNVTVSALTLGDGSTGSVGISVDPVVPSSIQTFTVRTGDPTGIMSVAVNAQNNIALIADAMFLGGGIVSANGNITVATNSGIPIDLGSKPGAGTLGLDPTEVGLFSAPNGTLSFGNSTATGLNVSNSIVFGTSLGATLATGGTLSINETVTSPGELFLSANSMTIADSVSTTAGAINIGPISNTGVFLGTKPGGALGLDAVDFSHLNPGSGVLRIGNTFTTGIQISAAIAPVGVTTLSLFNNSGGIGQDSGATITVPNLAVVNNGGSITLDQANLAPNVAFRAFSGDVSYTYGGSGPLTIGSGPLVDNLTGIQAGGNVIVTTDEIAIPSGSSISAFDVTITRHTTGALDVGSKPGMGVLGIDQDEFNRISANTLYLGGNLPTSTVNSATVTSAITANSFSNLSITSTGAGMNALRVDAPLASTFGDVMLRSDGMTLAAAVSAPGTITVQPFNTSSTAVNIGGADMLSTTNILGLDSTDIGNLQAPNIVINGNGGGLVPTPAPAWIYVSNATDFGARNVTIGTALGGDLAVNAALTTTGELTLLSDTFLIGAPVSGGNVTLNVLDSSRSVDLGTAGSGSFLLDNTEINAINTPGTFTLSAGTINVPAAIGFMGAANVALKFNTSAIAGTVTSNGRLTVAARDNFTFDLLSAGLTPAAINNLRTTGVLQIGDFSTGALNINQSVMPDAGVSALALVSNSGISQTAGNVITAPNLAIQTFGSVNLIENNSVGTLAASSNGTFNFTSVGSLTVGPTVDGLSGLTSFSNATVKADSLNIAAPASGTTSVFVSGTLALAPRVATDTISVGSKPGGFGISTEEMDRISAGNLQFGTSTHAGAVNVTADVTRTSGSLGLVTGAGGSINVNFPVTNTASFSSISMSGPVINVNAPVAAPSQVILTGIGANSSVNVNAAVTAQNSVALTADNVQIAAPIGSPSSTPLSSATVQPTTTGRPISLGTEASGAMSLTAAELALIQSNTLTIGNSAAGAMSINAPLAFPALDRLILNSNASITQNPDSPILLQKVSPTTGQRVGRLDVFSSTGSIDLRAANEVPGVISGSGSTGRDFLFANTLPTRLQNIQVSGLKVVVNGGLFGPLMPPPPPPPLFASPPPPEGGVDLAFQAQLLASIDQIADINDALDATSQGDKKKEEEERKKQQECK